MSKAKKRRRRSAKRVNLDAVAAAARQASEAHQLERKRVRREDVYPVPRRARAEEQRGLFQAFEDRSTELPRSIGRSVLTERKPRQLRLNDPRRMATIRAMELAAGRPIGRRTREKLRGLVPDVVHETLCKKKRVRREVMFAKKTAGKGKTRAARKPRQLEFGRC